METPKFTGLKRPYHRNRKRQPGKSQQFIRIGIQKRILQFGYALKQEGSSEYNYFCPDKKGMGGDRLF